MVHIRRVGLGIAFVILVTAVVAAFVTEGLGLALIVLIGALVVAAFVVPFLAVFEEEHDLPSERFAHDLTDFQRARAGSR
jgi:cell division protein FtsW (lipid II flippase)